MKWKEWKDQHGWRYRARQDGENTVVQVDEGETWATLEAHHVVAREQPILGIDPETQETTPPTTEDEA